MATSKSNNNENGLDKIDDEGWKYENTTFVDTRRILYSKKVGIGKRPYMVNRFDVPNIILIVQVK